MTHILAQVRILDYQQFMATFTTKGLEARQRHGCTGTQVFTTPDPNQLVLLFDWQSPEAFTGFLNDPLVKETMKASGTVGPPVFSFMDNVSTLPG